jgi:hypothetical protein
MRSATTAANRCCTLQFLRSSMCCNICCVVSSVQLYAAASHAVRMQLCLHMRRCNCAFTFVVVLYMYICQSTCQHRATWRASALAWRDDAIECVMCHQLDLTSSI